MSAIMPSVVMLSAIMLIVEVPQNEIDTCLENKKSFPLKLILTIWGLNLKNISLIFHS